MGHSVVEHLRQELECEDLLACVHGLTALDRECYRAVATSHTPLTVDDVAAQVDRERSTAYRSVQRLLDAGFLTKEQVNYDQGGYFHVYRPVDPDDVADELRATVDDWHAEMTTLIEQFRDRYGGRVAAEPAGESP